MKKEKRHGNFGKNLSQQLEHKQIPKGGRNQASVRLSVYCLHATPAAMRMKTTRNSVKVKLGIKVMVESLIGWEVTVNGQGAES